MRNRLATPLALLMALGTLTVAACTSPTDVSETEIWRISMDEGPDAVRPGRMYFYLRLNRTTSSSQSCPRITTFAAGVEAIDMRLQPGGDGSANGNWSDAGSCSYFQAIIRMNSGEQYELVGPPPDTTRTIGFALGNWFGPNGRWGGWRMDMVARPSYHPDTHLDIEVRNSSGVALDSMFVKTDSTVIPMSFRAAAPGLTQLRQYSIVRYDSTAIAYGPRRPVTYTFRFGASSTPGAGDVIVRCRMDAAVGETVGVTVNAPGQVHACVGWSQIVDA